MEIRAHKISNVFLIASIAMIMIHTADAMNLGTLQKSSYANVSAGETKVFRVLMWSSDAEEQEISINRISVPQNWIVLIRPERFWLSKNPLGKVESIFLPGSKSAINAKTVDVYITVPEKEYTGTYEVLLNSVLGERNGAGFSLFQERKLAFRVNVIKGLAPKINKETAHKTVIIDTTSMLDAPNDSGVRYVAAQYAPSAEQKKSNVWTYAVAVIVVLLAWRLYKHD